jgi:CO/xanthine dehydrogenase FAD-binding subunit
MLLSEAEFHQASTLEEASDLMARFGAEARLLAGGTDVLVDVKRGRFHSAHVVSLNCIASLRGVAPGDGRLRIGALTTINQLATSAIVRERFPAILDATRKMAGPQIRNMATVGGNLCNANRCADLPPIFMAMSAYVILWSRAGQRDLPLETFFLGPNQTAVQPGEVLTEIVIPYPPKRFGAAFARFSLRESNAIAVAGIAASLVLDKDGVVRDARIGLSAAAPIPILMEGAAALLIGRPLDEVSLSRAAAAAVEASHPISDIRGQADFRLALVSSLTRTALIKARKRAQTEQTS